MQVLLCPEKSRPEENKDKAVLEYTAAVDAWAVGIVCYELIIGHPPFERESPTQTSEHIMYRAPPMPPSLSPGAKHFIISALVKVSHHPVHYTQWSKKNAKQEVVIKQRDKDRCEC